MADRHSSGDGVLAAETAGIIVPPRSVDWQNLARSPASVRAKWLHPHLLAYLGVTLTLLALLNGLRQVTATVNHVWFVVGDATGVALAIVIGLIALAYYQSFGTRSLVFLSIGFIGSGIIDALHIIQVMGLDPQHFSSDSFTAISWSSLAARLYLAIMLLVGWRASEGRISPISASALGDRWLVAAGAVLLTSLLAMALLLPGLVPLNHAAAVMPVAESMVGLLYFVTLVIFLRRGDWRHFSFQHWLVLCLILAVISQLFYLPLVVQAGDTLHLAGNGLRLGSYMLAFTALLSSTSNLFRQASDEQRKERINALISQSGHAREQDSTFSALQKGAMGAGTFELDLVTGQVRGNQVAMGLLGGEADPGAALALEKFREIRHPDDALKMTEALRRSQADGELFKQQFRVKGPGGYQWLEAVGGVEFVAGKPVRLLGFVDDISARKSLELEKDRLYLELDEMISAVDQFAVSATLDRDGVILAANGLFCEFCGVEEAELIGRRFDSLILEDSFDCSASEIWQSMRDGTTWRGHISLCDAAGTVHTANASLSPHLNDNCETDAFIFLGIDVTSRLANRQALEESMAAHKKSNDELQLFAHIVSHDLQEPLRMVSSFMTLLERRYAGELKAEAREFIQFAVEGSTRMRNLLDGLLEYSRVRSRDMVLEQLSLNKPVADAMANLAVLIRESGAVISVAALPEVRGDGSQLMQLFQNLIANAIKFHRDQAPKIDISSCTEEGRWVVEVSDNGIGIEPAHYQKIFQIFSRLHTREAYPGTGVGLAICKQIMERHGGRIEVRSQPGQGTSFRLCF